MDVEALTRQAKHGDLDAFGSSRGASSTWPLAMPCRSCAICSMPRTSCRRPSSPPGSPCPRSRIPPPSPAGSGASSGTTRTASSGEGRRSRDPSGGRRDVLGRSEPRAPDGAAAAVRRGARRGGRASAAPPRGGHALLRARLLAAGHRDLPGSAGLDGEQPPARRPRPAQAEEPGHGQGHARVASPSRRLRRAHRAHRADRASGSSRRASTPPPCPAC